MRQNTPMRLDHVSYAASHDQISDVVNRIGSQIGTAFVDGGIHPKFGTRNFTAPLLNGQYLEIVCPLDHPATDATPFGQAVKKKTDAGGGWMAWVISVENIKLAERVLQRNSIEGVRRKPDGTTLKWKQIGVLDVLNDSRNPFFIEWISMNHPSKDGSPKAKINKIVMNGDLKDLNPKFNDSFSEVLQETEIVWQGTTGTNLDEGINFIEIKIGNEIIKLF
jgi:hypothetical protein